MDPSKDDNQLPLQDFFNEGSCFDGPIYRCLWYWYEIEARIWEFKKQHPHVPIFNLSTEALNDTHKLMAMFNALSIAYTPAKLLRLVGTKTNIRSWEKKPPMDASAVAEKNSRLLKVIEDRVNTDFLST